MDDSSSEVRSFSLNGHILDLKNPDLSNKTEAFGEHRLHVIRKLYVDGGEVGSFHMTELSWTTKAINSGNAMFWYRRLFTVVDETRMDLLEALFAFYHIRQYGDAVDASKFSPDTITGPFKAIRTLHTFMAL